MSAIDICYARLSKPGGEEGRRPFAYNDATGKRVTCQPGGNLTIAVGVNLETGLDDEEIDWMSRHRLQKVMTAIQGYPWYQACDAVRQSVLLDVAFNEGIHGLLGFPSMLHYILIGDWTNAAKECSIVKTNPKVDASRYAPLRALMLAGGTQ